MTGIIAILIIALTAFAQAVVLISNASTLAGNVYLIYIAASLCYFLVHWAEPHVEELAHLGPAKYALMGMWIWVSLQEVLLHMPSEFSSSNMLPLVSLSMSAGAVEALVHVQKQAICILIRLKHSD